MTSANDEVSVGFDIVNTDSYSDSFGTAMGGTISLQDNINPFSHAWKYISVLLNRPQQLKLEDNVSVGKPADFSTSSFITVENEFVFNDFYMEDDDFEQMTLFNSDRVDNSKKQVRFDVKSTDNDANKTNSFNPIYTSTPTNPALRRIRSEENNTNNSFSSLWGEDSTFKSQIYRETVSCLEMCMDEMKAKDFYKLVYTSDRDSSAPDVEEGSDISEPKFNQASATDEYSNITSSYSPCQTMIINKGKPDSIDKETSEIIIKSIMGSVKIIEQMIANLNDDQLKSDEILKQTSFTLHIIQHELQKLITKQHSDSEESNSTSHWMHGGNEADDDDSEYMGINLLDRHQFEL